MEFDLDHAIEILSRTPATLRAMLEALPEPWPTSHEGGESWSPFEVLGHLIHGERTDWLPRVRLCLAESEGGPHTFAPFDRFAQIEENRGKRVGELLDTLEKLRWENLETVRGLGIGEAELGRRAIHPALGEVTLRQLLSTWVTHDLSHVAQISRVMARQYADEVGPWREYMPILTRR